MGTKAYLSSLKHRLITQGKDCKGISATEVKLFYA